jgi:hypothetical protein
MEILVLEASNRYTHLFLVERDILALIHLRVLLLNKYEIDSIYEKLWQIMYLNIAIQ